MYLVIQFVSIAWIMVDTNSNPPLVCEKCGFSDLSHEWF